MRKRVAVLFAAVVLTGAIADAQPSPYTRVLLPMYYEQTIPGAFGSEWQARFAIHNLSAKSWVIEWCSPMVDSGCIADLWADEEVMPNETQNLLPARYPKPANGAHGAVIYLLSNPAGDDLKDLAFQLRVTDTSRSSINAGTEVPVIREKFFRTSELRLVDVPAEPRFRLLLRLFEMNLDRAEFTLRVVNQETNEVLSETPLATIAPAHGPLRFQPGFAEVADLSSRFGEPKPAYVRVEIVPRTPGAAFWAYVSVTNNESQQVTLVTPQ